MKVFQVRKFWPLLIEYLCALLFLLVSVHDELDLDARRFCALVPSSATTIADVCAFLSRRHTRNNRVVALYLDNFRVPSGESVSLLKQDDVIT